MGQDQIAFFSNLIGGCLFFILGGLFAWLWRQRSIHFSLLLAAVVSVVWHVAIATHYRWVPLGKPAILLLEIARDGAWINALLGSLKFAAGRTLPNQVRWGIHAIWIGAMVGAVAWLLFDSSGAATTDVLAWAGLILAVVGLVAVEQLYRNTHQHRLIKLLAITIGALSLSARSPASSSASSTRRRTSSTGSPRLQGPNATSSLTVVPMIWLSGFWNTMPHCLRIA